MTPLMLAAHADNKNAVACLLHHGANPNACGSYMNTTPLMFAARNKDPAITSMLLLHRANVQVEDRGHMPAWHYAGNSPEIRKTIEIAENRPCSGQPLFQPKP
jgi:ankyrin repeat protein